MLFIIAFLIFICLFRAIMIKDGGAFREIILTGFLLRFLLLICTCTDILPVLDAHGDADNFNDFALGHPGFFSDDIDHLTNYTRFLSLLYVLTDDSRWFAQFLNFAFGILCLLYLRRIVYLLDINETKAKYVLLIASLMPFQNVYSVVLMREAWVNFFIVLSMYHFICWYLQIGNSGKRIILTLTSILLASWMHAGAFGLLIGYFLAFVTYFRIGDKVRISKSSYAALFFLLIFAIVLILNANALLSKFIVSDFAEYAATKSSGEGGESDYLTWLDLSSPQKILMFLPLKVIYFIYSPIIVDWRGINDVVAFMLDSTIYLYLSWVIFTRKTAVPKYRLLKRYLLISFLVTTVVFAFGTSNTGTAIRHRAKICSVMLIMFSVSSVKKGEENIYEESV